tara:strand:+ start:507 stop:860 length:354 start_codon:yes stop_codon:yes gene_type:complete
VFSTSTISKVDKGVSVPIPILGAIEFEIKNCILSSLVPKEAEGVLNWRYLPDIGSNSKNTEALVSKKASILDLDSKKEAEGTPGGRNAKEPLLSDIIFTVEIPELLNCDAIYYLFLS